MHTTETVRPGNTDGLTPEFGRHQDVRRLYGIKRGTLYNLVAEGKIRSVSLRARGRIKGVRLFDLDSIRNYILSEMASQEGGAR